MNENKIIIFDTTLRDGEQSPGASMNTEEKIRIARQLERLNVDVMEVGFAAASRGDFDAIHQIAKQASNASICSLARAVDGDIKAAGEAIEALPKELGAWITQYEEKSRSMLEMLQGDGSVRSRLKQILIIGMLTGVCEEILLRGALQPLLIRLTHSPIVGILLTAIIFSLLHQSVLNFLPIMVLALWFGCLRYYSGSIVWGVLIHILNNSLALF